MKYSIQDRTLSVAKELASSAVQALIEEAELTPKPGLVDRNCTGSHTDMNIDLMVKSAKSLYEGFSAIALIAYGQEPSQVLREKLAQIGRETEAHMLAVTEGVNTHRGAIWALGLLTAGVVIAGRSAPPERIAAISAEIARYPDRNQPEQVSNGLKACQKFEVNGARGEAEGGFPHAFRVALPSLRNARKRGLSENFARLDALAATMSQLDDTCVLHRGGLEALHFVKQGATRLLALGGASTHEGWTQLQLLVHQFKKYNISPGGSADVLASALFLDNIANYGGVENRNFTIRI